MKVIVYGTESDKSEILKFIKASPELSYITIRISAFSDYDDFVASLGNDPPEIIVITVNGANGMEGVIAAKSIYKNIPVIWFSDDKGFGVQSYRLGCTYFHEKPFSSEILYKAISKCLGERLNQNIGYA